MVEHAVPGFLPSVHGLHFANAFPPGPTFRLGPFDSRLIGVGDAAAGLCGGMAMTARDLWAAGVPAPPETEPPANGSRRFNALVRRQVQSLDWLRVPVRYAVLALVHSEDATEAAGPAPNGPWRRGPVRVPTVGREWPRVRAELDAGRPCLLELIRAGGVSAASLARNHQVLAWAYEVTPVDDGSLVRLRVYDPNHPGRDDVALEITTGAAGGAAAAGIDLRQTTGEPLLGFFRGPVLPDERVAAWR
jgi:hypothetical protein